MAAPAPTPALEVVSEPALTTIEDLPDEMLREILLRVSPHRPETLFAATVVCRKWCDIILGPQFDIQYRQRQVLPPPLLGFVGNSREFDRDVAHFVPATRFQPHTMMHPDLDALDSRHGRVLLHSFYSERAAEGLLVWDPLSDEMLEIAPPATFLYSTWTASLLCTSTTCTHMTCNGGTVKVVFVGASSEGNGLTSACLYDRATSNWSIPVSTMTRVDPSQDPSTLVNDALFFTSHGRSGEIIEYCVTTDTIYIVEAPTHDGRRVLTFTLMTHTSGGLQAAWVTSSTIQLYIRDVNADRSSNSWIRRASINLWHHLPDLLPRMAGVVTVGFAEGIGLMFRAPPRGVLYAIDLDSYRIRLLLNDNTLHNLVPFLAFCRTPGHGEEGAVHVEDEAAAVVEEEDQGTPVVKGQ